MSFIIDTLDDDFTDICTGKNDNIISANKPDDVSIAFVDPYPTLESCFKKQDKECELKVVDLAKDP